MLLDLGAVAEQGSVDCDGDALQSETFRQDDQLCKDDTDSESSTVLSLIQATLTRADQLSGSHGQSSADVAKHRSVFR